MPTATFTPAAAAYSAGDCISVAQELQNMASPLGGKVRISCAELLVSHTALISGETSYRLHLYNITPPSAHADNDAWDLPSGDRASYLGFVDLGTPVDVGSSLYVQTLNINKDIVVASSVSGGSVWAELVTIGGFTATAAARKVTLHVDPFE